jgi:hypothetical protein
MELNLRFLNYKSERIYPIYTDKQPGLDRAPNKIHREIIYETGLERGNRNRSWYTNGNRVTLNFKIKDKLL